MVVVKPLEINNEAACSLQVLSHLRSNKRQRQRENEAYCHRDCTFFLSSLFLFFLLLFTVSPFLPSRLFFFFLRQWDDDRESKLSARRTKS